MNYRTENNLHGVWRQYSPIGVAVVVALVGGCMVGPDYKPPKVQVSSKYGEIDPEDAAKNAEGETSNNAGTNPTTSAALDTRERARRSTTRPVELARWWTTFDDPALDLLIQRAVEGNLDLQAATERILEARAARGVTASGLFPELDASGGYSHTTIGKNAGFGGAVASGVGIGSQTGPLNSTINYNLYSAGFDATWEIDVFGGTRRAIEAATYDVQATIEDRRDVLVTLLGEVAVNYVELRGAQRELEITRQNLQAQKDTLELTRSRYKAGIGTDLDVARAEGEVATTEADVPPLQNDVKQAIHRLSVLLGREPNALERELAEHADVPEGSPNVPIGLPSDLLRRRPDVRRAERQLAAATARIGVATADLFPKFSLTGSITQESAQARTLLDKGSFGWAVGPSATWDLIDFGKVTSNIKVQNALQAQALTAYEQTVLTSLQNVADSLVAYDRELMRRVALARAVDANRRAFDLVNQQFTRGGIIDFLTVLDAQRAMFSAELQLVQSDTAVSSNLVALYKALGGGWETIEAPSEPRKSIVVNTGG